MQVIFDVLWYAGERMSFMLIAYGGWLFLSYHWRAPHPLLRAAAALALNEGPQRGAMLTASKQAATLN